MIMACAECDRLSKLEVECTRRAEISQELLNSFVPQPPYGSDASTEFRRYEQAAEESRASMDKARRERVAHFESHALTLSR